MSYDVLVIDPPWPKQKGGRRSVRPKQGRELDYKTMPVSQIFDLLDREIFPFACDTHVVFLWAIDKFLADAEACMRRRRYKLHARLVWDKGNGVAPAFTVRYSHEYLLWYYKPKLLPIAIDARGKFTTVMTEPSREHSRKPEEAYRMIEVWYPNAARLDVFSREPRDGWAQWGDECDHFKEGT